MDMIAAIAAIPGVGPLLPYVMMAIAVASAIAPFVPPPAPDSSFLYAVFYRLVQWAAVNVGQARNAVDPKLK